MRSLSDKDLSDFVESIYASSTNTDPSSWTAVYDRMATLVSSGQGGLTLHSTHDDRFNIIATTVDPDYLKAYFDHFQFVSPFRRSIIDLKVGERFSRRAFVTDSDFLNSPYYNEFYKGQGVFEIEHHALFSTEDITGGISLSRPKNRPDFTRDERRLIAFGIKHLGLALRNYVELVKFRGRGDLLASVLDNNEKAIFLIDSNLKASFYNRKAELLLSSGVGVRLSADKKLRFASNHVESRISDAIRAITNLNGKKALNFSPMTIESQIGTRRLNIEVTYVGGVGPEWSRSGRQIMISISSNSSNLPRIDQFVAQYGLTRAETRIVRLLADGHSTSDISDSQQITANTLKSHIKNIYRKSGCNRRSDLIRMVLQ